MNKHLLLMVVVLLISFPVAVSANPTKAKLYFKYRSNGSFSVDVAFDQPTTTRCIARHRSSLYYEGDVLGDRGVIRQSTLSRNLRLGRMSTSLRASGLNGVKQDENGLDPIIAVQVRIVCSGQPDISSNIKARFIKCGAGAKRTSLSKYLSDLKYKLLFTS